MENIELCEKSVKPRSKKPFTRLKAFKPWAVSVVASAVIIVAMGVGFHKSADNKVMNNVYAMNITEIPTQARGGDVPDITEMTKDQLKAYVPQLEKEYAEGEHNTYDQMVAGLQLSLVYMKLHDRSKAEEMLNKLIADYPETPISEHASMMLEQLKW